MSDRPELNKELDANTFRKFYYLKEELVEFCRINHLPTSGGKIELTERIACFLETGKIEKTTTKGRRASNIGEISEETVIESGFVCSEKHRAFFREKIGKGFSFNVIFFERLSTKRHP